MSADASKMLRLIRASTGLSAGDFAKPLKRHRGAVEVAEKADVSEETIKKLIGKALAQYAKEIPDFLASEANKLLDRNDGPTTNDKDKFQTPNVRSIDVHGINQLGEEEVQARAISDCPSKRAFAITVSDSALEPEIRKGSLVILDLDTHLTEGALVGVSLSHGGILVRRYSLISGMNPKLLLTSPRPNEYPPRTLNSKREVKWIYPVYSVTTRYD